LEQGRTQTRERFYFTRSNYKYNLHKIGKYGKKIGKIINKIGKNRNFHIVSIGIASTSGESLVKLTAVLSIMHIRNFIHNSSSLVILAFIKDD